MRPARALLALALGCVACDAPTAGRVIVGTGVAGDAPSHPAAPSSSISSSAPDGRRAREALAGGLRVALPERAADAVHLEDPGSAIAVRLRLVGARAVAFASAGDELRAAAATPTSGDYAPRITDRGVEDFVTLGADDLARVDELARFRVELEGVAGLRLVGRALELLDASGRPRIHASPPLIRGADGAIHRASVRVEGCAVDLDPRPPWGRAVTAPGAPACDLVVGLGDDPRPALPAVLDPAWTSAGSMTVARSAPFVEIGNTGTFLFAGGSDGDGPVDTVELFDGLGFTPTAPLLPARSVHALVAFDGPSGPLVAAVGGCAGGSSEDCVAIDDVQVFDLATGAWSPATPLVDPRANAAKLVLEPTALGTRTMLAGGFGAGDQVLASTLFFDPTTITFAAGPPLPGPRIHAGATSLPGGHALIVGGRSSLESVAQLDTTLHYDPSTNAWSALAPLPFALWSTRAVPLDATHALIAGGRDLLTPTGAALVLDVAANTWTATGALAHARSGHVLRALDNGWIAAIAGDTSVVELYRPRADPAVASWAEGPSLPTAPSNVAAFLEDGDLLVAGGLLASTGEATGQAWRLALSPLGEACTSGGTCASGECADEICCDSACDSPCTRCVAGRCEVVDAGSADPRGLCGPPAAFACGQTGVCAAAGACAVQSLGIACACEGTAPAGAPSGTCDGLGTCVCAGEVCVDDHTARTLEGSVVDCTPFRCGDAACRTECASSSECVAGFVCDRARACVPEPAFEVSIGDCAAAPAAPPAGAAGFLLTAISVAAARARRRARARPGPRA